MMAKEIATQVKLDAAHRKLLVKLAERLDLNMSQVIRRALREMAKREKIG